MPVSAEPSPEQRYVGWFHDLDAWTEYWDIYHPETLGRFYFGDGDGEQGLLTRFLPRERRPPAFVAWTRMALATGSAGTFAGSLCGDGNGRARCEFVRQVFRPRN
jgi:hypothetical protein